MSTPSATSTSPPAATSDPPAGQNNSPTNSPLLFFVALGFGVVFTNLWIIVGVKYCFRYNQRNRQLRNGEDGEPIEIGAVPRAHRRRREKKLMTIEEVNERFPLTKYKQWRSTRAEEGLPTAGGITAPPSPAASLKDEVGIIQPLSKSEPDAEASKETVASPSSPTSPSHNQTAEKDFAVQPPQAHQSTTLASTTNPNPATEPHNTSIADDEDDDDVDHIQPTLPAELLPNPGDTCAICLDVIEDDDDVRGLACGHAFHASCVDPWLTSRRACCPLCKADYYVPKPRDPASENDEGSRTRNRVNMPAHPPFAFLGGSTSRHMPFVGAGHHGPTSERTARLGGRSRAARRQSFLTVIVAENNDRRGRGSPQVGGDQPAEGGRAGTGTGRIWSRTRSTPNAAQTAGMDNSNDTSTVQEGEQNQRRGSSWRERMRGIPMFGGRSRSNPTEANATELQQQPQHGVSPSQLEAGTAQPVSQNQTDSARVTT